MEQIQESNEEIKIYFDPQSKPPVPNAHTILRVLIKHGTKEPYKVTMTPIAEYYELKGKVDSQWTHDVVVSMVPAMGAPRHIIDHLIVASDTVPN